MEMNGRISLTESQGEGSEDVERSGVRGVCVSWEIVG